MRAFRILLAPSLLLAVAACSAGDGAGDDTAAEGADETGEAGADDTGGSGGDDTGEAAVVHEIDVDTLAAWLDEEAAGQRELLLINVHVPYAGQIPGTDAHVPYDDPGAIADTVGDDLGRLVVLYCRSGSMSAQASADVVAMGYTALYDLQGGMNAWEAAGYELEQ